MIINILKKIFGSRNDRLIRNYYRTVKEINAFEASISALSDSELRAKTDIFKQKIKDGASLDSLIAETFAVVREAGKRTLGMRHFDVQLIGGMVLHHGKISEMRTGEGKTLMATLPAYLNALSDKGVHIVTVNDYLATRDAEHMGKLHNFLGLSVGVNLSQMENNAKIAAYQADITYGTNNEFGFDYLRDNMVYDLQNRVQRGLNFAIIDEVDSILIDEARTPLIISGPSEGDTNLYTVINKIAPLLSKAKEENAPGDYWVDEKGHQVHFHEEGHEHAEQLLQEYKILAAGHSLYDAQNINLIFHLNAALRAHNLFFRNQHYVIQNGEVIIVDEFTGRLMPGRRWSDGLHQAVEAKENVEIQQENQTMASITFQNYFRLYQKLSGMTGTAETEAYEFEHIYNLETVIVPTHRPMIRKDFNDMVFKTTEEKYQAIIKDIRDCQQRKQPVLVGTTSIENSEELSKLLNKEKLEHQVLNAKQHAKEADIVAQAGRPAMITIATNMAGRGTDIVLGGNISKQREAIEKNQELSDGEKKAELAKLETEWLNLHNQVVAAGGLHIIGSERHESRRIDNQLRGRSGRQGDPGSSRFYLSLDDSLLRIFAGDRIKAIMERLKMPEGEAIEHPLVSRSLESAQRKVEARNFDIRKQLLEYDDVANDQRRVIYSQRNELLEAKDISETINGMRHGVLSDLVRVHIPENSVEEQWDIHGLELDLKENYALDLPIKQWLIGDNQLSDQMILEKVLLAADQNYQTRTEQYQDFFRQLESNIMLSSIDQLWREHLSALDHLRQGIHLRGYAQKNPKQEYKNEAFMLFESLLNRIAEHVTKYFMLVRINSQEDVDQTTPKEPQNVSYRHDNFENENNQSANELTESSSQNQTPNQPYRAANSVGRNEICPCGSGKKYKHCHGVLK